MKTNRWVVYPGVRTERVVSALAEVWSRLTSADPEGPVRVRSHEIRLDLETLSRIARAGILDSKHGQRGGYTLPADFASKTLHDLAMAVETPQIPLTHSGVLFAFSLERATRKISLLSIMPEGDECTGQ